MEDKEFSEGLELNLERAKEDCEKKFAALERNNALKRKVFDLEVQLGRARRDLELDELNLKPAVRQDLKRAFDNYHSRFVTDAEVQTLVNKAVQQMSDELKRMFGG